MQKPEIKEVKLNAITFDEKIYPRSRHDPKLVQRYAETIDVIEAAQNYISVTSDLRLLDGRHRQLAYATAFPNELDKKIKVFVYPISDDDAAFDLAAQLNSSAGWQMTEDDKCRAACKMYARANRKPQTEIAKTLGVGIQKVNNWLSEILERERKEREEKMWQLWLSCHDEIEIASTVGFDKAHVSRFLAKSCGDFREKDSQLFSNFQSEIYTLWNFGKSINEIKHFGNIPPEILDNLLYYYTKPFDVVFDPFAGGGMTIDVCSQRMRRYYVSDLTPIATRGDAIRTWDITNGLPPDLPVPDLVLLDPPYWKQAEGKYSDKKTDLANMSLDSFIANISNIAKLVKQKWHGNRPNGRLALIIGTWKNNGCYLDLPFLCYKAIEKYLELNVRIQVPYSTQIHGGAFVSIAKEKRELLYLSRDLMVFKP